jgi:serine/threonine protein kinase
VGSLDGKSFTSLKQTWTFGKLLGTGGFGAVYEVADNPNLVIKTVSDNIKNGQDSGLFLEKAVYLKLKDPDGEGDKHGIPQIVDSGRLSLNADYFIVMPRFEKVINDILDTLKTLSKKGYLHFDLKAENIMRKNGRWYLIDYGMAQRFARTETTINPKKAGNGTPWFMARDAHKGLMSRKADLESLVYTIVEMEGYKLPWRREKRKGEKDNDYLQYVLESKQNFFDTYKNLNLPQYYNTFIEYVDNLQPGTEPNYDALKLK